jgi:membrane protein
MAYYGLFSLFPLLLVLISAGSFVLEGEEAYQQVISWVGEAIPISPELIGRNIQQVLQARGPVGLVGLAGTLWSATGFFNALARNVNRAWQAAEKRAFIEQRLVALGMVGVLVLLLFLSLVSAAFFGLLPRFLAPAWNRGDISTTALWSTMASAAPWLFKWMLFLALFRWVPNTEVPWRVALVSALVTAAGWEAITRGFVIYLSSGLASYKLVYGSLGAVVALMFWIYLSCWITLFGAHLGAAMARHIQKR